MNYNEKVVPAHKAKKEREKNLKGSSSKKTSNVKRSVEKEDMYIP